MFIRLEEAETNYFITAKYTLALVSRAHDLFKNSEVTEKQVKKFWMSIMASTGGHIPKSRASIFL